MAENQNLPGVLLARIDKSAPIRTFELIEGLDQKAATRACLRLRDYGCFKFNRVAYMDNANQPQNTISSYVEDISLMEITGLTDEGRKMLDEWLELAGG